MDWISLQDTRPKIAEWVLGLCSKGSYWLCFRANGGWYVNTNYGQIYQANSDKELKIQIAYWLPVPKLPEELFMKLFPDEKTNPRRPRQRSRSKERIKNK